MRFFIRNKTKYDPSVAFTDPVITVNVDHTQEITKIKEEARKVGKACKITALYVARQDGSFVDLADDRTINYYNLQDDTILETTSNPFWVTTLYSNMRRREQEAASNPEDARLCFQAQKSYIRRCMAIGLLLNGTGETEKQPATFHALEDLYEYCLNQGKKPAYMSQFTLEELQEMFETYQEEYQNHKDPIGSFIYSQAVKLGYLQDNNTIDSSDPFRSHFEQSGEQQRDVPARRNGGQNRNARAGGRRRANRNRTCDDCEVAIATSYCADCNPPLCLCDTCWRSLHRGATRKNHQMKDISEAPTPTTYTPQAYRAPFAMLVAFHRALQEQPQKLSLTAEDIKTRAQPFTDTDLEEAKKRGKPFSGFDSLENALIKHDIVLKEAAATPKYSLLDSGKELALKCSNFDYAMQALLRQAEVPTVPVPAMRPAVFDNRQVCLLVDTEEPQKDRFVKVARERGLSARVRKLPSGDFCWILLPPGAAERDVPEQELVLPYLVERKTWDDLWSSVRSPRFENQVQRMKACGIQNLFYLVEGSPKEISGRPGPEVETFLQGKLDRLLLEDKFFVNRTPSWLKTVEWLCHLTNLAIACQQARSRKQWMTFAEFSRKANSVPAAPIARNAKPVSGIVWPASDFADNIKSHHKQQRDLGSNLDHVQQLSDSILIIQGLTAYNTACNSHLKKALADYLQLPGQTAEECVQIHLEDYTDQLISVNVFQYYVLALEVFKGVRIFRTETDEETQEFLSRFGANGTVVKCDQGAGYDTNRPNDQPVAQAANRDEDMLFANDSQEEEFMLNQALQKSLVDENGPHIYESVNYFGHNNEVDDVDNGMNDDDDGGGCGGGGGGSGGGDSGGGSGSGSSGSLGGSGSTGDGRGSRGNSSSGGGWGSSNGNGGDGTRKPTPKSNIQPLFNPECKPTKQPDTNNYVDKNDNKGITKEVPKEPVQKGSISTVTVKQETEEEENDLENILQFKFYDSLTSHSNDEEKEGTCKSKHDSKDNKLHKIVEKSQIQFEKEEEERKALLRSVYDEEEELRKAIELSKKMMEQKNIKEFEEIGQDRISNSVPSKNSAAIYRNNEGNNEEDDLLKIIELSKKDRIQNKMDGKEMGNLMGKCSGSDTSRDNHTVHSYDDDDELRKVIELSKRDAEQKRLDTHDGKLNLQREIGNASRNNFLSPNNFSDDDIQLKKAMELSKQEFRQNMQEISQTDPTLNSQDSEHEDCFYDLEVPDFANSGTLDDGVEFSSEKNVLKFSYRNSGGKYSNINLKSSRSTSYYSSLNQKKWSESSINGLRKDDSDDEAVLVEIQEVGDDDDDDYDDISRKFKERFGNSAKNSKEDKNSSSHYSKDDSDAGDDSDDDNDIVKKFRERFGNAASNSKGDNNYNSHDNSTLPTEDAILVDSQEMEEDKTTAQKLQEGFDKETSHIETNKNGIRGKNNSLSINIDDAILIDSQDEYTDEHIAQTLQEQFDKEGGRSKETHDSNQSNCFADDTILVDSQDDVEADSTSDFEIALQLQKDFNQQGNHSNTSDRPPSSTSSSTSSKIIQRVNTSEQISSYREEQQKRFRKTKTGKAPKNMPPGLAFRQKAEAIARGKESLLAVVQPLGTTDSSTSRRKAEKRGHDGTIKNRFDDSQAGRKTARKSCPTSTSVHTETRNSLKNTSCLVFPASSSSPRPQEKDWRPSSRGRERSSSSSSSLVFPGSFSPPCGSGKQSTPKSSGGAFSFPGSSSYLRDSSSSYQNNANSGFVFPSSSEFPCSPSPRPSRDTLTSNASQSGFKSNDGLKGSASPTIINGPKCSDCNEIGHRKGTKRCPYYYTEEAHRKREEQARKRKEKREEEDRQMQTSIEALAAEQLRRAEQANQLRRQIEQLTQQNDNLPKVVEDAMKYLKKRRKK